MALSRQQMVERMLARDAAWDGRFITGVLTTGIYCLPSCKAKNPKPENVRFFGDPRAAREAGLRPCKRCRPDDFYRRHDPDRAAVEGLAEDLRRAPGELADVGALAERAGVGLSKLHALCRRHFHTTPARLLARARVGAAAERLLAGEGTVADIAFEVGYESLSSFHETFRRAVRMTPGDYRRLRGARELTLSLPRSFRLRQTLAHLGRDPESRTERVAGRRYRCAAWLAGAPAVLEVELSPGRARCLLEAAAGALPPRAAAAAHHLLLRRLGLTSDPAPFERRVGSRPELARLIRGRRGLRVPLTATPFEGLVWTITGQQINLPFAFALVGALVELAGRPAAGGLHVPPRPEDVARLEPADLRALRYSRTKAEYLVGAARRVAAGDLSLERLAHGSAARAEEELLAVKGLGPWSAGYLMMRGLGFEDCVPVGDSGLVRALERFFALDHRPGAEETEELMTPFAPDRTYATFHLWQSLEDTP